jgi:hypothetical protein
LPYTEEERKERRRDSLRRYNASAKGKAVKSRYRSTETYAVTRRAYAQTETYKANHKKASAKRRKLDPRKNRCKATVNYRIKTLKMPQATFFTCASCKNPAEHFHHDNYDLWWSVTAFCGACHRSHHDGL